jgi:hypothetical protein
LAQNKKTESAKNLSPKFAVCQNFSCLKIIKSSQALFWSWLAVFKNQTLPCNWPGNGSVPIHHVFS